MEKQLVKGASRNPKRTHAAILEAATDEFAAHGFGGARVDAIAARAKTNKRMLYHYFGDKEALYLAVLEATYASIRTAEKSLDLTHRDPEEGMRELALFTWNYFLKHPEFLSLLATENMHQARYLKRSDKIAAMHSHFIGELSDVLKRGEATGIFRPAIDPVSVYLTIAALGFFYLSNRHTLSTIFGRDLTASAAVKAWGEHIVSVTLASIKA
ncbi:TetR/AcrR family transcriptional regulator [Rhizobium sp. BK251]|uniref:TetR/AcrR family transcriptional regulator n=1 Tax=Rhizobium sp. BK251 TaxID=2512125 RepID=UPI00104D661F|nr:TetR/AcrR family transcriptional regulator [Rhizobium sp. BK251]